MSRRKPQHAITFDAMRAHLAALDKRASMLAAPQNDVALVGVLWEREAVEGWLDYANAMLRHHGLRVIDVALIRHGYVPGASQVPFDEAATAEDNFVRIAAMASPAWVQAAFSRASADAAYLNAVVAWRGDPCGETEQRKREAEAAMLSLRMREAA